MNKPKLSKKPKYEAINRFLLDEYVLIHLNPKSEGVSVPAHLIKGEVLTLKLSKLFRGAMELTREKVTADLLFEKDYFNCIVPLAAIWGATSAGGETLLWPESAPESVLKGIPAQAQESAEAQTQTEPQKLIQRGHLTRVK